VRRVVARVEELGLRPRIGVEDEFYLLEAGSGSPVFPDPQVYAILRNSTGPAWRDELLDALPRPGIPVSAFAAEHAPGQFEVTFAPGDGIGAADQAFVFRTTVKEIAARHGVIAPFMPRPFASAAGSGCHLHHSLCDTRTAANALGGDAPGLRSPLGRHFTAGLVATPGRSARCSPPRPTTSSATGRPSAAGLRDELNLPPESAADDTPPLSRTLDAALDAREEDGALRAVQGADFVRTYLRVKRNDVARARAACEDYWSEQWRGRVDDWERCEYGELI
jgi:glutamine synthetase